MIGKVSPEDLKKYVFSRTGTERKSVLLGPAYGEDTAAIKIGQIILVVNSDPIIFAADQIGTLGINIASNDVAASGADPQWLTVIYLLPAGNGEALDKITGQVDRASRRLGISIVGGHSEFVPILNRPFLGLTCFGTTDKYIPTGGAKPGDAIVLTKGAGVEGTGIIATDFHTRIKDKVDPEVIERGREKMGMLSVIPEASILRNYANSMHDPTEGGIIDGLLELAVASGVELVVDEDKIIISPETRELCAAVDVDPLKIFGSGALLATVPRKSVDGAVEELKEKEITAAVIGYTVEAEEPLVRIGGNVYKEPVRDQLYRLWE
jgi:hydrogenase expression/formation protein HypE